MTAEYITELMSYFGLGVTAGIILSAFPAIIGMVLNFGLKLMKGG